MSLQVTLSHSVATVQTELCQRGATRTPSVLQCSPLLALTVLVKEKKKKRICQVEMNEKVRVATSRVPTGRAMYHKETIVVIS